MHFTMYIYFFPFYFAEGNVIGKVLSLAAFELQVFSPIMYYRFTRPR